MAALRQSRSRLRRVRTLAVNWASCRDESIPWVGVEARAIYSAKVVEAPRCVLTGKRSGAACTAVSGREIRARSGRR